MEDGGGSTILIVDDDHLNRMILSDLLEGEARLVTARNGREALEVLAARPVHLVLLDVNMPDVDGYETLRRMRERSDWRDIGVIFITGLLDPEDEERGLLSGAADYIRKPFRPATVRARVKLHLRLSEQRRALERLTQTDSVTGVANRRYFDGAVERELGMAARAGAPIAIALLDIDNFDQFSALYGPAAADSMLRQVAAILTNARRRDGDVLARYDGAQFVFLAREVEAFGDAIERARRDVEARRIPNWGDPEGHCVTISAGGFVFRPDATTSARGALDQAAQRLRAARVEGRNRTFIDAL